MLKKFIAMNNKGQITIPKKMREQLGLDHINNEIVLVELVSDDEIKIKKFKGATK